MRVHRAVWLTISLAATSLGCKDEGAATPAPTATAQASATTAAATGATSTTAPSRAKAHMRVRRGVAGIFFRAAEDLDLKDDQRATIEKLAEGLRGSGARAETKAYHAALAAQIRAGKIETAKLDAAQAAVDKAQALERDKEADALAGLHAALDPAQRKALVATIRARQPPHVEQKGDDTEATKRRVARLAKQLDLDAAQQKRVEPLAKAEPSPEAMRDEMKKNVDAVLAAFEADAFDAKKALPPQDPKKSPLAAHTAFLASILPILKPEQREKLAASVERTGPWRGVDGQPMGPSADEPHEGEAPAAP